GKTTLLIDFTRELDSPVAWYVLDRSDRDLRLFIETWVAAVRERFPNFGEPVLERLRAEGRPDPLALATLMVNALLALPDFLFLVLDDYHEVDESEPVNAFVDALLRLAPENLCLLLVSRTLPDQLDLLTLVARRQTAGLGTDELRFQTAEVEAFLELQGLEGFSAQELAEANEGWIAGIVLSTQMGQAGALKARGTVAVADYLAQQVFERQPEDLQRFLTGSAVLDRMTPELCNWLLDRSDVLEMFELLERRNLLVQKLGGDEGAYRYHQLFREFLLGRLRTDASRHQELQRRAGQLLEARGEGGRAISHYQAAGDYAAALRLITRLTAEAQAAGRWEMILGWLEALPREELEARPDLHYLLARSLFEARRLEQAVQVLQHAKALCVTPEQRLQLADLYSAVLRDLGRSAEALRELEEVLPLVEQLPKQPVAARVYRELGVALLTGGDVQRSRPYLQRCLELAQGLGDESVIAWTLHDLGFSFELAGELDQAQQCYRQAVEQWGRITTRYGLGSSLNALGVVHYLRGEYRQALSVLERALEQARSTGSRRSEVEVLLSIADVYKDVGALDLAARTCQEGLALAEQIEYATMGQYALVALGDTYRLQGDMERARELLQRGNALAEQQKAKYRLGLAALALGILALETDQPADARRELLEAVQLFSAVPREQARARLHLAALALAEGNTPEARRELDMVASLVQQYQCHPPLVVDARRLPDLLVFASHDQFYADLAKRLEQLQQLDLAALLPERAVAVRHRLQAFTLGEVRLELDGQPVAWVRPSARELCLLLLCYPQGLPKEELCDKLWPELTRGKALGRLKVTLYRLRRSLGWDQGVLVQGEQVRLHPELEVWADDAEFLTLTGGPITAPGGLERYKRALGLYRGRYLPAQYTEWVVERREQLNERYLRALEAVAEYYARRGGYVQAAEVFERAMSVDQLCEAFYRGAMRCSARAGDLGAVKAIFERCAATLRQELDTEPDAETQELYQSLVAGATKSLRR
ncbi:MAG: tetratricopeptide repeat protein, partial [Deinococcus sp.]|nr:tetratricopeptide repeat protein [Deinococcus sp.]